MTTHSIDNGHSLAGLYGLSNPIVTWLIGRGYGELVALTPEELHRPERAPICPGDHGDERNPEMRYRPAGWVCYDHKPPIRLPRPPRLQEIPRPPFSTFDVIGKTVELVYTKDSGESHASWKYLVDGRAWE